MSVIKKGKNRRRPYTVRYWAEGRQRERSFFTSREARDFQVKVDHDLRARIFTDPRAGTVPFGDLARAWLDGLAVAPRSRTTYAEVWAGHLDPALGSRTLAQVARDRDGLTHLLTTGALGSLSVSRRGIARLIVTGVLDEAVLAGKIPSHRCAGIELADHGTRNTHRDFVFPSHAQVAQVAEAVGTAIWLMRGCGLRIEEALAVERADFREDGTVLRLSGQATRNGKVKVPLKHRKAGEYRDIPVPGWLWKLVTGMPDGPLCPGFRASRYMTYAMAFRRFKLARAEAGIPAAFTMHSLRHAFASALLARGVPITDVAVWLGHRDINTTFSTYGHLVPSAAARAAAALDDEWAEWLGTEKDL